MGTDEHIVDQGQLLDDLHVLEGAHQAQPDDIVDRQAHQIQHPSVPGAEHHLAPVGVVELGDAVEGGGLARAVGSDEAEDLLFLHVEGEGLHRLQSAELDGQVVYVQHQAVRQCRAAVGGLSHFRPLPSSRG